jgi:hypothetical protein
MRLFKKKRIGAVTLEFLFAFIFLLIFFVVIFAFQIITLHRIEASYSTWRIERVRGISNGALPSSDKTSDEETGLTGNETFDGAVMKTLKDSNILIKLIKAEGDEQQTTSPGYEITYNIDLLKGILKYIGDTSDAPKENIRWTEPKWPKIIPENN